MKSIANQLDILFIITDFKHEFTINPPAPRDEISGRQIHVFPMYIAINGAGGLIVIIIECNLLTLL